MSRILITGGRLIDPSQGLDQVRNLLIEDGRIAAYDVAEDAAGDAEIIDAAGKIVAPGLIDIGPELRQPGGEEDETIESGTAAALAGGFAAIACAPNTDPPIDTQGSVEFVLHQAARANHCRVHPIACVSKNRQGEELSEIGQLVEAGAVAFSDIDAPIFNAELLRRAFQYFSMFDRPVLNRPEVAELTSGGVMHDGDVSLVLGLSSIPAAAEDVMISRDCSLAEATNGRLHLTQVTTAEGTEIVRRAKQRDVQVTCGVAPAHFTLIDQELRTFDSRFKLNPPLRSEEDRQAVIAALADGTIDVICSGHAPHAAEKKLQELDQAPFGAVGLETTLALVVTELIDPGHLTWTQAVEKLSTNPARVLGVPGGTLELGEPADVTIIDPDAGWSVSESNFLSQSGNTPFIGRSVQGKAACVIVNGTVKLIRSSLISPSLPSYSVDMLSLQ